MPRITDPALLLPEIFRPILLACMTLPELTYEDLSTIFRRHKLLLKDIPTFNECVRRSRMGRGGQFDRYGYGAELTFTNTVRQRVLETTDRDAFLKAAEISGAKAKNPHYVALQANILAARDGRPLDPMPAFESPWSESFFWRSHHDEVSRMFSDPSMFALLELLPDRLVIDYVEENLLEDIRRRTLILNNLSGLQEKLSQSTFWGARELHALLELQQNFMLCGDPKKRLAALKTATPETYVLQAVALLSEGSDDLALKNMRMAFKVKEGSRRVFDAPLENFLFGLTLWRCRRIGTTMRTIESLAKYKDIGESACLPLRAFLLAALQKDVLAEI
ncbi:MAG: hypothetical protein ACI4SV_01585, partial [Duodenibacillus sp.]